MLPLRPLPLVVLFAGSLLASNAIADSADLKTTIYFPFAVAPAGRPLDYTVNVENLGPDVARDVDVSAKADVPGSDCTWRFDQPLQPGQSRSRNCVVKPPAVDTLLAVTAVVTSAVPDPDPTNNSITRTIPVVTNPKLFVDIDVPIYVEPGLTFDLALNYGNVGGGNAENTEINLRLPAGVEIRKLPAQCNAAGELVTCGLQTVPATLYLDPARTLKLQLIAPDMTGGGTLRFVADISSSRPDLDAAYNHAERSTNLYRAFLVTNTADAGAGSLRQAITDANAQCGNDACEVQFRLDTTDTRWASIKPQSPLPAVTALNLLIDGSTQTRFGGDTNLRGPEIEINGAGQQEGDGLVIESPCISLVGNLALNGFAGSAVRLHSTTVCPPSQYVYPRRLTGNYIGLDPTGTTAVPNLRGVTVQNDRGAAFVIDRNVISGNTRSALFVDSPGTFIRQNVIGLDAQQSNGLGNGASGIFVSRNAGNTDIADNAIAFNHDFGIAIERGTRLTEIHGNSIHANWQPGIDIGLDGATAATEDPAAPSDLSARYDPLTNTTIIEGTSTHAEGTLEPIIRLFANDAPDRSGFGQGQYYLGETRPLFLNGGHRFTFTWPGDLRDKFIAATATRYNYFSFLRVGDLQPDDSQQGVETQTSEFSRTVEVK